MDEYNCAICQYIITKPISFPCKHSFCHGCVVEFHLRKNKDCLHLEDKSRKTHEIPCPLCRQIVSIRMYSKRYIDHDLEEKIKSNYPKEYAERIKQKENENVIQKDEKKIMIAIGNQYQHVKAKDQNENRWKLFVRLADGSDPEKVIKRVRMELHPTFEHPKIDIFHAPFEIIRYGWGTFEVPITIWFHDKAKPIKHCHELKFHGKGEYNEIEVSLD